MGFLEEYNIWRVTKMADVMGVGAVWVGVGMGLGSRVVGREMGWTWEVDGKGGSDRGGELGLLLRVGGEGIYRWEGEWV